MPPRSYRFSSVWHLFYIGVNQRGTREMDTITGVFVGSPDAGLIAYAALHFTYIFGTYTSGVLLRAEVVIIRGKTYDLTHSLALSAFAAPASTLKSGRKRQCVINEEKTA